MSNPHLLPVSELAALRVEADAYRGEWLQSLRDDVITLGDFLTHAADPEHGKALRGALLTTVLAASFSSEHGSGAAKARQVMARLKSLAGEPAGRRFTPRVRWLLSRHVGMRRIHMLATAMEIVSNDAPEAPWPGYPLAPRPEGLP